MTQVCAIFLSPHLKNEMSKYKKLEPLLKNILRKYSCLSVFVYEAKVRSVEKDTKVYAKY